MTSNSTLDCAFSTNYAISQTIADKRSPHGQVSSPNKSRYLLTLYSETFRSCLQKQKKEPALTAF